MGSQQWHAISMVFYAIRFPFCVGCRNVISAMDDAHLRTYVNGQPYRPAKGHRTDPPRIVDSLGHSHSVVSGKPNTQEFLRLIHRELKIRFYSQATQKNYIRVLARFLDWFGRLPHQVEREDVRQYLELMVDGGASSAHVSLTLSALRTAFDKFCFRATTTGLATPRRPGRQPVVLSQVEVRMMLEAARCLRDKLLMSLMYGIGLRVSEVSRLKWMDVCFDRQTVRVVRGKGQKDRLVILPARLIGPLQEIQKIDAGAKYVFPAEGIEGGRKGRHISPRTVQRAVERTSRLAGIERRVTPHSFRHSFATHLIEDGLDIRFIQKLLGHSSLETTTLYTRVAKLKPGAIRSPLDQLTTADPPSPGHVGTERSLASRDVPTPVGQMRVEVQLLEDCEQDAGRQPDQHSGQNSDRQTDSPSIPPPARAKARLLILPTCDRMRRTASSESAESDTVELAGILLQEARPGWVSLDLPSEETWSRAMTRLPNAQQQRLRSPDFLDGLRVRLTTRFLQLLSERRRQQQSNDSELCPVAAP